MQVEWCRGNESAAELEKPELHFQVSRLDLVIDADGNGMSPFWQRRKAKGNGTVLSAAGPSKQPEVLCG